jgi:hypothetical protein
VIPRRFDLRPILPTPPLSAIKYSYADAHAQDAFLQQDLIRFDKLARLARQRGIVLGRPIDVFEWLDREGSFRPIAFAGDDYPPLYLRGRQSATLSFVEDEPFAAWETHAWERDGMMRIDALYSPWQVLYLEEALRGGEVTVSIDQLDERLTNYWESAAAERRAELAEFDHAWRSTIRLLVRLQNQYLPRVVLRTKMRYDTVVGDWVDPREDFDAPRVLDELDLSSDEIKELYEWLAAYGERRDPADDLYSLIRLLRPERRRRLRRSLLLAHDVYDACAVLRRFYFELTDEVLWDVDEQFSAEPDWKERLLRHDRWLSFSRADADRLLDYYDIYPHAVLIFVEGQTEENLITELLAFGGVPLEAGGIKIKNLGGGGNASENAQDLFSGLTDYARVSILIADRERQMAQFAQDWIARGLVTNAEAVFLSEPNLEEANFTTEELIGFVAELGRKQGKTLTLDAATLRSEYEKHCEQCRHENRDAPGIATFLCWRAGKREYGGVGCQKPAMAPLMAELIKSEIRSAGDWDAVAERRPIVKAVLAVLKVR